MTIAETLKKRLEDNGLFPDQALGVLEAAKADPANASVAERWDHDTAGYPPPLLEVLWMSVRLSAAHWIDANCPQHWARPLFAGVA